MEQTREKHKIAMKKGKRKKNQKHITTGRRKTRQGVYKIEKSKKISRAG